MNIRELHTDGNYNRKPFRSKALKEAARRDAKKCDDGAYRSSVPVLRHPPRIEKRN